MVGIYKITNKINGKIYIGQSVHIIQRWSQHKYQAKDPTEPGYNSILHEAFRKYGVDNFIFEIVAECSIEELDEKEIYWIQYYNSLSPNGYNITLGGQKYKRSNCLCANCNKPISSGAVLCKECNFLLNCKTSDISDPVQLALDINTIGFTNVATQYKTSVKSIKRACVRLGLPSSRKEIKEWLIFNNHIEQPMVKRPYTKSVKQIDPNTNEVLFVFNSIAEAARSLGCSKGSHITEACQGKLPTAYGYKWQYVE